MRNGIWLFLSVILPVALASPAVSGEMTGIIHLPEAVDAAVASNPELRVSAAEIDIKDAQTVQAGLRPNPVARLDVDDIAGTGERSGWDSGETTLGLSQLIELGKKREKRLRSARLERDVAAGEHLVRRRNVIAETTAAFASVLVAQERFLLADELLRLSRGAVDTVAATVKTGAVSPIEEHRAAATLARAQAERSSAERDLNAARISLAATWGGRSPTFTKVAGQLEPLLPPPPLATLLAQSEFAPEVARIDIELAQRRAALDVESAKSVPNVTIGAGVRHYADRGDAGFVLGFEVPLPLFDRNQGNILAASREISQTELERTAALTHVQSEVLRAYETQKSSLSEAAMLRDMGIPEARRTYEGAKDAYQKGLFRYLEVLDAQRTMFELRAAYLDAVSRYYEAAADLVRWTAVSDEKPNTEGVIR